MPSPRPPGLKRRFSPGLAIGLGALVLLTACVPLKGNAPAGVIVWGDSLSAEARPYLGYEVRAHGGIALCDVLDDIARTAATNPPAVAVLEFAGNGAACIGSRPKLAAYAEDIAIAVRMLTQAGSRVVIVGVPPWRSDLHHDAAAFNDISRQAATANPLVAYSHRTVAALTRNGHYADFLPCLPDEGPSHGCAAGQIRVRAPDGAHFGATGVFPYAGYSSGARRFAAAIAASV